MVHYYRVLEPGFYGGVLRRPGEHDPVVSEKKLSATWLEEITSTEADDMAGAPVLPGDSSGDKAFQMPPGEFPPMPGHAAPGDYAAMPWGQLRAVAAARDVNTAGMKRPEIENELRRLDSEQAAAE